MAPEPLLGALSGAHDDVLPVRASIATLPGSALRSSLDGWACGTGQSRPGSRSSPSRLHRLQ
jgi:hypothetical protein